MPSKVPRIGFLATNSPTEYQGLRETFRQGLRDLGYAEGQNIAIEYRWAEGWAERFFDLAGAPARRAADEARADHQPQVIE